MDSSAPVNKDNTQATPNLSHMAKEPRPCHLLKIPAELRLQIYGYLLDECHEIFIGREKLVRKRDPRQRSIAIRRVCKIINKEFMPLLHANSVFVVLQATFHELKWPLSLLDSSRIRKLELVPPRNCRLLVLRGLIPRVANSCPLIESLALNLDEGDYDTRKYSLLLISLFDWKIIPECPQLELVVELRLITEEESSKYSSREAKRWMHNVESGALIIRDVRDRISRDMSQSPFKAIILRTGFPEDAFTTLTKWKLRMWHFVKDESDSSRDTQNLKRLRWTQIQGS